MSAVASCNGAYVCRRCLRVSSRQLFHLNPRGTNLYHLSRHLATAVDATQEESPRKKLKPTPKPKPKHKSKDNNEHDSNQTETQQTPQKLRQQSWTHLLHKKSLGQESSVLVLRDTEAKRQSRKDIQKQDASSEDALDANIISSLNKHNPEPTQDEVFSNIKALQPQHQVVSREDFDKCVESLRNSFSSGQLRSFVNHHKAKAPNEDKDTPKSALTRALWKPTHNRAEGKSISRNHLAEEVMRATWGIEVEDEISSYGFVTVRPINPDLLDLVLAGGRNSVLKELAARLQMRISFHEKHKNILIFGNKKKCLHALAELDAILRNVDVLLVALGPFKHLRKEDIKAAADHWQCAIRLTEMHVVIRGRDRDATLSCQRLLVSLLPVGFDEVRQNLVSDELKAALIVQTDEGRASLFRDKQSLGRLISPKQLHASQSPGAAYSEDKHTQLVTKATKSLNKYASRYQNLKDRLASQSLPTQAASRDPNDPLESQTSSASSTVWQMSSNPSLRAEFGHALHILPENEVVHRSTPSRLVSHADFVPRLAGLLPLSTGLFNVAQAVKREYLNIRLRPSPWLIPGNPSPKGLPLIEMKLSIDKQSKALTIEDVRAIMNRQFTCLLQPNEDFDMRLMLENSILLRTPGSNGAVRDYLFQMRDLTSQHTRLSPPTFLRLAIPRAVINFHALGRHFSGVDSRKDLVEIEWFTEGMEFEERVSVENSDDDYQLNYYHTRGGDILGNREGMFLESSQDSETSAIEIEEGRDAANLVKTFSEKAFEVLRKMNLGVDQQHLIESQTGQTRLRLAR